MKTIGIQETNGLLFDQVTRMPVLNSVLQLTQGWLQEFAAETNTIYLAQELLSESVEQMPQVFLEEYGHYLDSVLNSGDAPGDEGAIFAEVVRMIKNSTMYQFSNSRTLVIIDPRVSYPEQLVKGIKPGVEAVILNSQQDGMTQISQILAQRQGVQEVHLFAHGSPGTVRLGSTYLSEGQLKYYKQQLQQWFRGKAKLLLYSCKLTASEAGKTLVRELSQLTGAVVAASSKLVGNETLGGSWQLDYQTKEISVSVPLRSEVKQTYTGVFASHGSGSGSFDVDPSVEITASQTPSEDGQDAIFELSLSAAAPSGGITVNYSIGGSADPSASSSITPDGDYLRPSGSVYIAEGQTSASVNVSILDDNEVDPNETIEISLESGDGYTIGEDNQATLTISDNDEELPVINISSGTTPTEDGQRGSFELNLSNPAPSGGITVNYSLDGSATPAASSTADPNADYIRPSGSVFIAEGQTSASIDITPLDDNEVDPNETIEVILESGEGYEIGYVGQNTLTIVDNDEETDNEEELPQVGLPYLVC